MPHYDQQKSLDLGTKQVLPILGPASIKDFDIELLKRKTPANNYMRSDKIKKPPSHSAKRTDQRVSYERLMSVTLSTNFDRKHVCNAVIWWKYHVCQVSPRTKRTWCFLVQCCGSHTNHLFHILPFNWGGGVHSCKWVWSPEVNIGHLPITLRHLVSETGALLLNLGLTISAREAAVSSGYTNLNQIVKKWSAKLAWATRQLIWTWHKGQMHPG